LPPQPPPSRAASPHQVPTKLTGECGSVLVRLIPAPRGAGIVAARTPKKVLQMAGIEDCYTCSRGSTKTLVSCGGALRAWGWGWEGRRGGGACMERVLLSPLQQKEMWHFGVLMLHFLPLPARLVLLPRTTPSRHSRLAGWCCLARCPSPADPLIDCPPPPSHLAPPAGQLCEGHLLRPVRLLRLPHPRALARDRVHQVAAAGVLGWVLAGGGAGGGAVQRVLDYESFWKRTKISGQAVVQQGLGGCWQAMQCQYGCWALQWQPQAASTRQAKAMLLWWKFHRLALVPLLYCRLPGQARGRQGLLSAPPAAAAAACWAHAVNGAWTQLGRMMGREVAACLPVSFLQLPCCNLYLSESAWLLW
jgi:hypothetical protein